MSIRSVVIRLSAQAGEYIAGVRNAARATGDLRKEISTTASKGKGDLDKVAHGMLAAGAAMVAAVGGVVAKGAAFENAMAQVNAVSGATAEEFDAMRAAALEMGSTTVFSATEAANATEELAKAGLSASEIVGGALKGSLDLAAAGGIGLAEAAGLAASTMRTFGMQAHEMGRITDALASGANKSNTNVSELGQALSNVGVVAAQAGWSVEETTGILSLLADNSLSGAEAGTNLKTSMLRLLAPTEQARAEMERLGINIYNLDGSTKSAVEVIGELERGFAGMSDQQRAASMQILFGQRAIIGANILMKEGAEAAQDYIDGVSEVGSATETAAKRLDSLQGDITLLNSALEGLAIKSSDTANLGLRYLTSALTELVTGLSSIPGPVLGVGTVLVGLVGIMLLVGGTAIKVMGQVNRMNAQLMATGPAGKRAAAGLSALIRTGGMVGGVMFAILGANALVSAAIDNDLRPQIDALTYGLKQWGETGKVTGEAARVMGDDVAYLSENLQFLAATDERKIVRWGQSFLEWLVPGLDKTEQSLSRTRERLEAFDSALASMVQGGDLEGASAAFDRLAAVQEQFGISTEQLLAVMPQYAGALEVAANGGYEFGDSMGSAAGRAEALADIISDLTEEFDRLFGVQMDLDRARIAWEEGMDSLRESLGENSDSLKVNTEEGRENASMILDQIERTKRLYDAMVEKNGVTEEAIAWYQDEMAAIEEVARARGLDRDEVEELMGAYREIQEIGHLETHAKHNMNREGPVAQDTALYLEILELIDDYDVLTAIFALPNAVDQTAALRDYEAELAGIDGYDELRSIMSLPTYEARMRELQAYKDRLESVPDKQTTHVDLSGLPATYRQISELNQRLDNAARPRTANVSVNYNVGRLPTPGGVSFNRWGGVYHHAAGGLLRAQVATPRNPARYAWAEPATGGEAFIPRRGDRSRSLAILQQAAGWYDASVVSAARGLVAGVGGSHQWRGQRPVTAGDGASVTSPVPSVTYAVYPQRADFTVRDLEALQRRQDALHRVGRQG